MSTPKYTIERETVTGTLSWLSSHRETFTPAFDLSARMNYVAAVKKCSELNSDRSPHEWEFRVVPNTNSKEVQS